MEFMTLIDDPRCNSNARLLDTNIPRCNFEGTICDGCDCNYFCQENNIPGTSIALGLGTGNLPPFPSFLENMK